MKIVILSILLLFVLACSKVEEKTNTLISLVISNRNDNKSRLLDSNCVGFLKDQFDPYIIDSSFFYYDKNRNEKTGLKWFNINDKDKVINFNQYLMEDERFIPYINEKDIEIAYTGEKILTNKVIYLADLVKAEKNEYKYLNVSSDDGIKVFCNGNLVYEVFENRTMDPIAPQDIFKVKLKKGNNVILYKVFQSLGRWEIFRNFIPDNEVRKALYSKLDCYNIFTCLIDDSVSIFELNLPECIKYFGWKFVFEWRNIDDDLVTVNKQSYNASDIPKSIEFPSSFSEKILLTMSVFEGDSKIFTENIPFFRRSKVNGIVENLLQGTSYSKDPTVIERRNAIISMYNLEKKDLSQDKDGVKVSSRVFTHALLDLLLVNNKNDKLIGGPRIYGLYDNKENKTYPYKIFFPNDSIPAENTPITFVFNNIPESSHSFFDINGLWTFTRYNKITWYERSIKSNSIIVTFPDKKMSDYHNDRYNMISNIIKELKRKFHLTCENSNLITFSSGAQIAIDLLENYKLPIKSIGLMGGSIELNKWYEFNNLSGLTKNDFMHKLNKIKRKYPNLFFIVRHGSEDVDMPIEEAKIWSDIIKKTPFEVDFKTVDRMHHEIMWTKACDDFFEIVNRVNKFFNE